MTRICENCGFVNQDDYDFCAKCGTLLVEGVKPGRIYVYRAEQLPINKKALAVAYLITILMSWSGFIIGIISKHTRVGVFAFFGFFMPFYLIQSKHPTIKKHGFIMMVISLVGVALSFYIMLH